MKSITIILLSLILSTCGEKKVNEVNIVGNDEEVNGCTGSAGYIWSFSKKRCIRVWEEGRRFEIYKPDIASVKESLKFVYVVLSDDKSIAELIFTNNEKPILLKRNVDIEGDISPIIFENIDLKIKIQFKKDIYWILVDDIVVYFNDDFTENGFGEIL